MPVLCFVSALLAIPGFSLSVPLSLPLSLLAVFIFTVVAIPPFSSVVLPPNAWTFSPLHQTLLYLRDVGARLAEGRWVLQDLPCAALLAPLEAAGSPGARARTPLAPLPHLAVNLWGALHEFVAVLKVLRTHVVAPSVELVQAWPAPCARLTVQARLTVGRTLEDTLSMCVAADQAVGAALLAFAQVKVEPHSTSRAEVLVEAGVAL